MAGPIQIAVAGAGGQIGYSLVFRIAAGGLFGAEQPVSLRLLESPERASHVQAMQMELKDCAFPLLTGAWIGTDPEQAFEGVDWVILLAGRTRRTSERRSDLLRDNAPIFVAHGKAINEVAREARVLVVANPCNTNCLVARSHAPDVPAEHWFALMHLDRMRSTALLAQKASVPVNQIKRVTIWGNHSEQVFADFNNAWIGERPAREVIDDAEWVRDVYEPYVVRRSLAILERRGASPAGSAAHAIISTIRAATTPTPPERWFCAAVVSDGSYGVPAGLVFGFPLRTEDGESWSIVRGLYLDQHAQRRLQDNIDELEAEAASVTDMLGEAG